MALGLCPCGSGLTRAACDPRPFAICRRDDCRKAGCRCKGGCGQPFHITCNAAKLCPSCRPIHNRSKESAWESDHREHVNRRKRERRANRRQGAQQTLDLGLETLQGGVTNSDPRQRTISGDFVDLSSRGGEADPLT